MKILIYEECQRMFYFGGDAVLSTDSWRLGFHLQGQLWGFLGAFPHWLPW